MKPIENPIIDNRIVCDKTFAVRLKAFIEDVKVNDPMSEEEQEYLLYVANRLIRYQAQTAEVQTEVDYLNRIGIENPTKNN